MRVTGNSITSNIISQLSSLEARQARLQNQASTSQRISAPEDDPVGMRRALALQNQDSQLAQYAHNISVLQERTKTAATAFQSLKKISDRISELATQADGTESKADLQTAAVEVGHLIQQAVSLANTQDGNQYIFAGTASDKPPFVLVKDASGNITGVTYQGNASVTQTEIASGSTMVVDTPGENNTGSGLRGIFSDSRYGADFFNHLVSLQQHLQAADTAAVASTDRPALLKDEDNLIFQTANNAVVLSRLDTAASNTDDQQAFVHQSLTNVAGADLATTLVQLTQTQNAYQLAAQSSAKLLQLQQTLLSYL